MWKWMTGETMVAEIMIAALMIAATPGAITEGMGAVEMLTVAGKTETSTVTISTAAEGVGDIGEG